ncbi:MFS transporter [Vallitalea sediminicola]
MKYKNSILIISGNTVSQFGSVMFSLALNWWIIDTTNNVRLLGYVTAAATIPLIVLNLFGGVIADKGNKQKVLVGCDMLSGLLCIVLGIFMRETYINIPLVIMINVLLSCSMAIFSPTLRSIVPEVINKKIITKTNSILTNLTEAVKIIAPLVASMLFANSYIGFKGIFIINGISFIVSAISESFINYTKREIEQKGVLLEIKRGFNHIIENKVLFRLLLICAGVNFFIAGYNLVLPYYIKNVIKIDNYYSLALTIQAAGGIVGSILVFKKNKEASLHEISMNLILCGGALIITIIAHPIALLVSVFIYGLFLTKFNIAFFSYLQLNVDKEFLGRVFSVVFFVAIILMPLGNLVFGFAAEYLKNYIFVIIGAFIICCVFMMFGAKDDKLNY